MESWTVAVWPEYDQSAVLVIYQGVLPASASLPQDLLVPIPLGVRINAVAHADDSGSLFELPYEEETTAFARILSFATDRRTFVVEYYADLLTPPPTRQFDLTLQVPYAAGQATLNLRQPSRASDLQSTPSLTAAGVDGLGNPLYQRDLGALTQGQILSLSVSYTKPDAEPSLSALSPVLADGAATTSTGTNPWQPWLLGGLGLLAVVGLGALGYYALWLPRQRPRTRQERRRQARQQGGYPPARQGGARSGATGQDRFCTACGGEFGEGDRFCRQCGAPRR